MYLSLMFPVFRRSALVLCAGMLALAVAARALAEDTLEPQQLADGVYAFVADTGEATRQNRGFVGNSGFIVGATGVIVIDTGSSYRHGRRMRAAIAGVTDKPVKLVILTHAVQEFLFGNAAFTETGVPILAHDETAKLMQARCERCLEALHPLLGDELAGTRLVLPQVRISAGTTIEVGGRQLELLHFGWTSTPGDLAVLDRATGVLFAGGLVAVDRIPEIRDSDFEGWQAALEHIAALPVSAVVPGHGPVSDPGALGATAGYLRALDHSLRTLYAGGASLMEAVEAAVLPDYGDWSMYPATHRRNALHRYLQLEIEDLGGDPRSVALPRQ